MSRDVLADLPERLESLGTLLSEGLANRHGDEASRALVKAGVVVAELPTFLATFNAPPDLALDQFLTQALYNDGLTLVALACLRVGGELSWETLDDLLPVLKRFASFYATVSPRYAAFRTLERNRLGDFWNTYCADGQWFGLLAEATRFQGLRLCVYHDTGESVEAVPALLNGVLGPLWQRVSQRVGMQEADATIIWEEVEQAGTRRSLSPGERGASAP